MARPRINSPTVVAGRVGVGRSGERLWRTKAREPGPAAPPARPPPCLLPTKRAPASKRHLRLIIFAARVPVPSWFAGYCCRPRLCFPHFPPCGRGVDASYHSQSVLPRPRGPFPAGVCCAATKEPQPAVCDCDAPK
ncbi:unnamed protein product, partial [Amoebophrya sp. A120]|eukprot:GSA120T00013353001.1